MYLHRLLSVVTVVGAAVLVVSLQPSSCACFDGAWREGNWTPTACSIPVSKVAALECVAKKNLLFIGGSTTRLFITTMSRLALVEVHRKPCNLQMAWGCFDCVRGCHNVKYNLPEEGHDRPHWNDAYVEFAANEKKMEFSWKPSMFSLDDVRLLDRLKESNATSYDAVIVNKGVHAVYDWLEHHKKNGVSEAHYLEETVVRARLLASKIRDTFPNATLMWREAFFIDVEPSNEAEAISVMLRDAIAPIFTEHGFYTLPGYNITRHLPNELKVEDPVHPHEAVFEVLISMIASVICPNLVAPESPSIQ